MGFSLGDLSAISRSGAFVASRCEKKELRKVPHLGSGDVHDYPSVLRRSRPFFLIRACSSIVDTPTMPTMTTVATVTRSNTRLRKRPRPTSTLRRIRPFQTRHRKDRKSFDWPMVPASRLVTANRRHSNRPFLCAADCFHWMIRKLILDDGNGGKK